MIYLKELYDTEKKHFHSQIRRELIYELTKHKYKNLSVESQIADIGCASGIFLEHLKEKGYKNLHGIDPNPESIDFIRKNLPNTKLYSLYLNEYNKKYETKFDFVFLLDVLEHIENEDVFLNDVANTLKNNSRVIISVPAYQFLWSDHDRMCNHFRRYNKKSLTNLLRKNNFEIEFCSYYSTILFPLIILQKMISRIKKYKDHKSFLPSPFINKFFKKIYQLEIPLLKKIKFPYGSSLVCFAKKKNN